jgi:hypothetical protein
MFGKLKHRFIVDAIDLKYFLDAIAVSNPTYPPNDMDLVHLDEHEVVVVKLYFSIDAFELGKEFMKQKHKINAT